MVDEHSAVVNEAYARLNSAYATIRDLAGGVTQLVFREAGVEIDNEEAEEIFATSLSLDADVSTVPAEFLPSLRAAFGITS